MAKRRISQLHTGEEQQDARRRNPRRRLLITSQEQLADLRTNEIATLPALAYPERRIRLLMVEPGDFDDDIHCRVTTCALRHAPAFHAISYAWGDGKDQRQIFIDGRPFTVRQNCHYALRQARKYSPATPIWIDSVCIDQDNAAEKSAQVQMMDSPRISMSGVQQHSHDEREDVR
ncbi:heterokaryon incompatibility protein-domain-containing protein [Microdochium bolleyi]|uniref:Heterokaryon incompatibility protein-domain-containing protein n=1 Tax=Microdochium bolleyi TaxID=196109 RepID=A0A136INR8_9PEZI|nr:heterokaryon incompatibility protein-domain-containing protein [Microdochium bolleyi]